MKRLFANKIALFVVLAVLAIVAAVVGVFAVQKLVLYPKKYEDSVKEYSEFYEIDEYLVYAVMKAESGFNKDAVSSAGAMGLMQLTENTATYICEKLKVDYNRDDLFEPEKNIRYGTFYLAYLKARFTDTDTVLCAYNAGEGNVSSWLKDERYSDDGKTLKEIPFGETKEFLARVKKFEAKYKNLYD